MLFQSPPQLIPIVPKLFGSKKQAEVYQTRPPTPRPEEMPLDKLIINENGQFVGKTISF